MHYILHSMIDRENWFVQSQENSLNARGGMEAERSESRVRHKNYVGYLVPSVTRCFQRHAKCKILVYFLLINALNRYPCEL